MIEEEIVHALNLNKKLLHENLGPKSNLRNGVGGGGGGSGPNFHKTGKNLFIVIS